MNGDQQVELSWDDHVTISAFRLDGLTSNVEEAPVAADHLRCTEAECEHRLQSLETSLTAHDVSIDPSIGDVRLRLWNAINTTSTKPVAFRYIGPHDDRYRYRIRPAELDLSETGGQMVVWKGAARDGAEVAIKLMVDPQNTLRPEVVLARLVEAKQFAHSNLTDVSDVFLGVAPARYPGHDLPASDFQKVVAIEKWVHGSRLSDALASATPRSRLRWIREIAQAIAYLHGFRSNDTPNGFAHRDLKPDNIFIDSDTNSVIVMDLASGRGIPLSQDALTGLGGTEGWIAPEQLRARAQMPVDVDHLPPRPIDVYGVGMLAHFLVMSEVPQGDRSATLSGLSARLRAMGVRNADAVGGHIGTLLHEDPKKRPTDLLQWSNELDAGGGAQKRKLALWGGSLAAALLLTAGAWFGLARQNQVPGPDEVLAASVPPGSGTNDERSADNDPETGARPVADSTATPTPTGLTTPEPTRVDDSAPALPRVAATAPTAQPAPSATPPPPTSTLLPTLTPVPTATNVPPTSTPLPTLTPIPTATNVPPTSTPVPTPTDVPTSTPTPSPTPIAPSEFRCLHASDNGSTAGLSVLPGPGPLNFSLQSSSAQVGVNSVSVLFSSNAAPHARAGFQAEFLDARTGLWTPTGKWTGDASSCVTNANGTMHNMDLPDPPGLIGTLAVWTESENGSTPAIRFRTVASDAAGQAIGIYQQWVPLS